MIYINIKKSSLVCLCKICRNPGGEEEETKHLVRQGVVVVGGGGGRGRGRQ